jgi:hypothetical protein
MFVWKIREFWEVTDVLKDHGGLIFRVRQSQKRRFAPFFTASHITRLKSLKTLVPGHRVCVCFIGAFAKLGKATFSFVMSVRPLIEVTGRIFIKFDIRVFFENL